MAQRWQELDVTRPTRLAGFVLVSGLLAFIALKESATFRIPALAFVSLAVGLVAVATATAFLPRTRSSFVPSIAFATSALLLAGAEAASTGWRSALSTLLFGTVGAFLALLIAFPDRKERRRS